MATIKYISELREKSRTNLIVLLVKRGNMWIMLFSVSV